MPRANRYIVAGHAYHVTHRCHNRSFLFRFACDREEYRKRLRASLERFGVQLLTYEHGESGGGAPSEGYEQVIDEAVAARDLQRNPIWTESIAVGCEAYVSRIEAQTQNRVELTKEETGGQWILRETAPAYG